MKRQSGFIRSWGSRKLVDSQKWVKSSDVGRTLFCYSFDLMTARTLADITSPIRRSGIPLALQRGRFLVPIPDVMIRTAASASTSAVCQTPGGLITASP